MAEGLTSASGLALAFDRCLRSRGPVVVLVHGFAGARGQWQTIAHQLCQGSWSVYWVDLPGHGTSPPPARREDYHPNRWVDILHAWHRDVVQRPAWWVGHSLGGGLVTVLARRYGTRTVLGGVLVAPYLHRKQWHWWIWASRPWWPVLRWLHRVPHRWWSWALHGWWLHREYREHPQWRRGRVAEYLRMDPGCWWTVDRMREPFLPRPPGTWLVLAGARDGVLGYSSFRELARAWQVPLVTLPQAGHMVHLTHPHLVVRELTEVFSRAAPEAGPGTQALIESVQEPLVNRRERTGIKCPGLTDHETPT